MGADSSSADSLSADSTSADSTPRQTYVMCGWACVGGWVLTTHDPSPSPPHTTHHTPTRQFIFFSREIAISRARDRGRCP